MDMKIKNFASVWLPSIFTIVSGVFALMNYVFYDRTNRELTNARLRIENELREREFENNLKLTLYKEVKEAIGQKDTAMQSATLLVVNEMLSDDTVFRKKLINILLQNAVSPELAKLNVYAGEESATTPYTIDVFYAEDTRKETESRATALCSLLDTKYPRYTIRKRLLPRSVNARYYRVSGNQIRFGDDEKQLADEIYAEIQKNGIFPKEQPRLIEMKNSTPCYIGIFIRN
jgi:hypothetical protein